MVNNDLSKLDTQSRVMLVKGICDDLGLNWKTGPFQYINLKGRLTLYAKRDATDQLRRIYGVSATIISAGYVLDDNFYKVHVMVRDKTGRTDEASAYLFVKNLKAQELANELMKCETKAKRRATLSICGLGFLDELEVDDVKGMKHEEETVDFTVVTDGATDKQLNEAGISSEQWHETANTINGLMSVEDFAEWEGKIASLHVALRRPALDALKQRADELNIEKDENGEWFWNNKHDRNKPKPRQNNQLTTYHFKESEMNQPEIEIYTVEDDPAIQMHDAASMRNLMERAGAKKQQKFLPTEQVGTQEEVGDNVVFTINQFRRARKGELNVIREVCPTETQLADYDAELVPLRVLELAARLNEAQVFKSGLYVFHSIEKPDPFLVGVTHDAERTWMKEYYLIARWDDELCSWSELVQRAKQSMKKRVELQAKEAVAEFTTVLDNIDAKVEQHFEGGGNIATSCSIS